MEVLSKDIIVTWLVPHLPFPTHGRRRRVAPAEVVGAILYKLKTGCQWRWLPVAALFSGEPLSWQGVYYPFHTWSRQGVWKKLWLTLLRLHRRLLDLSSVQLDGRHTRWRSTGWPSSCCCYAESTVQRLPKQLHTQKRSQPKIELF